MDQYQHLNAIIQPKKEPGTRQNLSLQPDSLLTNYKTIIWQVGYTGNRTCKFLRKNTALTSTRLM
jgi:hypothetical protein